MFVLCAAFIMPFMPDDSFISFRYAEHLADGHGLTFNVDEPPVEAYSNFLWIVVCAALHKVGLPLPAVTPYAGIALSLASLYVLWTMCRRRAPLWQQQLVPLLLLATCGPFVIYAVSGMEAALFAFLLLLVVKFGEDVAASGGWRPLAALTACGFLASLARPEGVVVFPVVLAVVAWDARREPWFRRGMRAMAVAAAIFGAATIVYHAWRVSYFNEWLPTPFLSKGAEGEGLVSGWHKNFLRYFVNWAYLSPPQGYVFLALFAIAVAGLRASAARASGDRLALAVALVLAAIYLNFVDWMPGMRYHAPIAGILLIPARHLHRVLPAAAWESAASRRRLAAVAAMVLVGSSINLSHLKSATDKMGESSRLCYVPLGEWARANLPADALLAMGDVGIVPYYSRLRTLDIHAQSLTDAYIAKQSFSADYVLAKRPDMVALSVRGVYSARTGPLHWALYKSEEFRSAYAFVGTVRNQWYEDRAYWVFVRNDHPLSDEQVRALPKGIGGQARSRLDP